MKKHLLFIVLLLTFKSYAIDIDSVITSISSLNNDSTIIAEYHLLSWNLRASEPHNALLLAKKGYEYAEKTDNLKGMESCVNNIGVIHAMMGKYDSSLIYFKDNLELNIKLKSEEGKATANNNIGLVYYYKGDFSKSVEHYMKSLAIYDDQNNSAGKASTYNNLGLIYENKEDYEKALHYQKLALEMRLVLNKPHELAYSYGNIGNIYYIKEQADSALFYFLKAEKLFTEVNDYRSLSTLIGNLGKIYENKDDYSNAEKYYERALEIQERIGDSYGLAVSYLNLSEVNQKRENYFKAITYGLKGVEISDEIGAKDVSKQGYGTLRYSYFKTNQFEDAYIYLEKFMDVKDSIFSAEKQEKIAELETKYNTEQKEKENELLKKNNALNELKLDRSRILNYGISIGLVILLIAGVFIFKAYSQKNKAYNELEEKNEEILAQSEVIEQKNKDVLDSLNYAKRIQKAILPPQELINDLLPQSFFFYKPKDIVSGDFYWLEKSDNKILFAAVDCTGHGVPGAFMSIVGYNGLNHVLTTTDVPSEMLNELNEQVSNTLHQTENKDIKEGMDIALCALNTKTNELEFSGAYNSVFVVRNNEVIEEKGDRFAIGSKHYRETESFTNHKIQLEKGDTIYITTDGYLDQFGGEYSKKFKVSNFRTLIAKVAQESIDRQIELIKTAFIDWKGAEEQIDDICVIGVRV